MPMTEGYRNAIAGHGASLITHIGLVNNVGKVSDSTEITQTQNKSKTTAKENNSEMGWLSDKTDSRVS